MKIENAMYWEKCLFKTAKQIIPTKIYSGPNNFLFVFYKNLFSSTKIEYFFK